jgi:hypothetical protein
MKCLRCDKEAERFATDYKGWSQWICNHCGFAWTMRKWGVRQYFFFPEGADAVSGVWEPYMAFAEENGWGEVPRGTLPVFRERPEL